MIGQQFARLLTPVPDRMVRTVDKGSKGKFSYLGTSDVKQLLIYFLGRPFGWTIESVFGTGDVTANGQPGDEAWVCVGHLDLVIDGDAVRVGGLGCGNSPKAAESDALKRAAGKVGLGLSLYGGYWLAAQMAKEGVSKGAPIEVDAPTDDDE